MDNMEKGVGCGFALWFAFCLVLSLFLLGFGVWAIYELVTWVTAQ